MLNESSPPSSDEVQKDPLWDTGLAEAFRSRGEPQSLFERLGIGQEDSGICLFENEDEDRPIDPTSKEVRKNRRHGRYLVMGELARGGIGVVLKGRDLDLGRDVAMKVLRQDHVRNKGLVQRFVEEAQIAGQLQHPGIVPVYDLGVDAANRPFFAMKLIRGRTLAALLAERSSPTSELGRFLGVFEQVCQTLAYAHARGVVHRDLKPANVMIGSFGEVQVVDWGFAKVLGRGGVADERRALSSHPPNVPEEGIETVRSREVGSHSLAGSVMGTPSYMPPEQAMGEVEALDERADVFALGGILCEILTGHPPYVRQPGSEVIEQAAQASLDAAWERLREASVDEELKVLARHCLEPDRAHRPPQAGVVAERVTTYLAGTEERTQRAQLQAVEARVRIAEERKARRLSLALGTSLALLAVLATLALWWFDRERQAHRGEAEGTVREALSEARSQLSERAYSKAEASVSHARRLAQTHGLESDFLPAVDALSERVRLERQRDSEGIRRRAAEAELRARLTELRAREEHARSTDAEFAKCFKDHGIDTAVLSADEIAEKIRAHSDPETRRALIFALDDWVAQVRTLPDAGKDAGRELMRAARLADESPWRNLLRDALLADDRARLATLAKNLDDEETTPHSLDLLAMSLGRAEDLEGAIKVLRGAYRRFPNHYWINFHLATLLLRRDLSGEAGAREQREALEHGRIALALQPQNRSVRVLLSRLLQREGRLDEALLWHEEAVELQPGDPVVVYGLADLHLDRGNVPEALSQASRGLQMSPESALLRGMMERIRVEFSEDLRVPMAERLTLARTMADANPGQALVLAHLSYKVADFAAAEEASRKVVLARPKDIGGWTVLARSLRAQARYEGAYRAALRALELGDDGWVVVDLLRDCSRLLDVETRWLPDFLSGAGVPTDRIEVWTLARVCLHHGFVGDAARFFLGVVRDDGGRRRPGRPDRRGPRPRDHGPGRPPLEDPGPPGRSGGGSLEAACALALAAAAPPGQGVEVSELDRQEFRESALALLRDETRGVATQREPREKPAPGGRALLRFEAWRCDVRLAGVRAAAGLATLPAPERALWEAAWAEVDQLLEGGR